MSCWRQFEAFSTSQRSDVVIDRRQLLGMVLGTLATPAAAEAQEARKVYRIGILSTNSPTSDMVGPQPRSPLTSALLGGLRELGYVYGEHFVTELVAARASPSVLPTSRPSWSDSKWT